MSIIKKNTKQNRDLIEQMEKIQYEIQREKVRMNMVTDECLIDSCIYKIKSLERQYQYFLIEARQNGVKSFEKIS